MKNTMTAKAQSKINRAASAKRNKLARSLSNPEAASAAPDHGKQAVTWSHGFHVEHRPIFVNHDDRLTVRDYQPYSFFYFGSVAGCAAKEHANTQSNIARAVRLNHPLVWVGAMCSVIDCSGRTGEQKAMDHAQAGAVMHHLSMGAIVWFEGQTYQLRQAANHNVALVPVRCNYLLEVIGEGKI
jgi:hypothetical protein